jgi:membrane-associated phospholipid phosphatase
VGRWTWTVVMVVLLGGMQPRTGQAQPCTQPCTQPCAASVESATAFCLSRHTGDGSLDVRGLAAVYCASSSLVRGSLGAAHRSARPLFYGAVPAAWARAAVLGRRGAAAAAYRLTLSQGGAYGAIVALKHAVGRPRPYVTHRLRARAEQHASRTRPGDAHLSFPSGHAGLAATLATSWSMSHPYWFTIAPGALWAAGVALSRLHLGVHYPSDILAGAVLGVGIAVLVHHLRGALTPARWQTAGGSPLPHAQGVPLTLRLRF